MSEPLSIVPRTKLVENDIVERLEHFLQRAKAGELKGMALAYVTTDDAIGTSWSRSEAAGTLMGAVALLQHRLCRDDL